MNIKEQFKCVGVDSKHNHIKHRLWTNLGKKRTNRFELKGCKFFEETKSSSASALLLLACKCRTLSEKDLNF